MPLLWFPREGDGESGSVHLGLASLNHIILVGSRVKVEAGRGTLVVTPGPGISVLVSSGCSMKA